MSRPPLPRPSTVRLPAVAPAAVSTVLDFFLQRFPRVSAETWWERFTAGKVWSEAGPLGPEDAFRPLAEVHYRREVAEEPAVRRDYRLVFEDPHLLVVDKPPFLPVTPGGRWVRHCLLHLLYEERGEEGLAPLHRLDRLTSGLVVLSRDPASRAHFQGLFQRAGSHLEKRYCAVCEVCGELPRRALLADHVARSPSQPWRQEVIAGRPANARTELELVARDGDLALVSLRPSTGRKHQLRVQLAAAGLPVLGDPMYGSEPRCDPADLSRRLWLDAHRLLVRGFPGWAGGPPLDQEWTSGLEHEEMLRQAMRAR